MSGGGYGIALDGEIVVDDATLDQVCGEGERPECIQCVLVSDGRVACRDFVNPSELKVVRDAPHIRPLASKMDIGFGDVVDEFGDPLGMRCPVYVRIDVFEIDGWKGGLGEEWEGFLERDPVCDEVE